MGVHADARVKIQSWSGLERIQIVRPAHDTSLSTLQSVLSEHREEVRAMIHAGGVAFRGWRITSADEAEHLVYRVIGIAVLPSYPDFFHAFNERAARLGVPPDGIVQRRNSRTAPNAKPGAMQPPHTEYGLGPIRPRVGAFYCEVAPQTAGETGLCDLQAALASLPDDLRQAFTASGWWNPRCGVVQPCVFVHPETDSRVMGQLWGFTKTLSAAALAAYWRVADARPSYPQVERMDVGGNDAGMDYAHVLVDGDEDSPRRLRARKRQLSPGQSLRLFEAVYGCASFFKWQDHDLLIWDNVLLGHWRMPGSQPRRLHAFFGDEIDTRDLREPDCPHA